MSPIHQGDGKVEKLKSDQIIKPSARLKNYRLTQLWILFTSCVLPPGFVLILIQNPKVNIAGRIFMVIGVSVFSFLFYWYPRYSESIEFHIGKGNLSLVRGIWWRTVKYIPYQKITGVTEVQGPLERFFQIGRLRIQTAASYPGYPEAVLEGIEDATGIKKLLLTKIEDHNIPHS